MDESPLEVKIIIRDYDPETDAGFIYGYWRSVLYKTSAKPIRIEQDEFFRNMTRTIRRALRESTTKIACLEDCPIVTIGCAVYKLNHLIWVYVKEDYRNKGIATLLCPKDTQTVTPLLTRTGAEIARTKKLTIKGDQ